jgi:hypothetical protein
MGTNCSGAPRTLPSHAHTQNRADRGPLSDLSKDRARAVPTLALLLFFSRTVIDANQGATCARCVLQQWQEQGNLLRSAASSECVVTVPSMYIGLQAGR